MKALTCDRAEKKEGGGGIIVIATLTFIFKILKNPVFLEQNII